MSANTDGATQLLGRWLATVPSPLVGDIAAALDEAELRGQKDAASFVADAAAMGMRKAFLFAAERAAKYPNIGPLVSDLRAMAATYEEAAARVTAAAETRGAEAERKAVVAWLRERGYCLVPGLIAEGAHIERAEHRKGASDGDA
jgi:hypothetical protein